MKIANIISAMCVLASAFTACVNEMPVDGPDVGQPGELSIVFAVGDAQTKAADGYTYATDKEIQINDFHVALFDAGNHQRIGAPKDISISDASSYTTTEENNKKAYQVSFSDISTALHPSVYAVVIANYKDKSLDFSSCTKYDDYKKIVNEISAFSDTTKLMKVGKSANTTIAVDAVNKVVVPLTQLTARIDFKGVIVGDEPATKALSTKAGEVTGTSEASYGYLGEGAVTDNSILTELQNRIKSVASDVTWEPHAAGRESAPYKTEEWGVLNAGRRYYYQKWESSPLWYGYFAKERNEDAKYCYDKNGVFDKNEYYEVPTYYQKRAILVSKTYTETRTVASSTYSLSTKSGSDGKQFVVEKVVYSGFNTQSDIAIFDNTKIENSKSTPYVGTDKEHTGNTPFSFYTYERPANGSNPVTLSITGHFMEEGGSTEPPVEPDPEPTTETWKVTEYGYMIQSRGNDWPADAPTPDELAAKASDFVSVEKVEEKITGETKSLSPVTKTASDSKTYTLDLGEYGFIKGNCYSLTGYVKESNLEWIIEKQPWIEKSIDVNFGGNWGNKQ